MSPRDLERLATVAALACLVGFGGSFLVANRSAPPCPTEPPRLNCEWMPSIGTMTVGERLPIVVEITNPTAETRRILGVARCCGSHVCYEALVEPATIPPHGSASILVDVKATSVGLVRRAGASKPWQILGELAAYTPRRVRHGFASS